MRFQFLTALIMNCRICRNSTLCSSVEACRRFLGMYSFSLHGRRVKRAVSKLTASNRLKYFAVKLSNYMHRSLLEKLRMN
jgi:hypothetical protein